jgi:hypothetical protein
MGMSSLIFDNVDKFFAIADKTLEETETGEIKADYNNFRKIMLKHTDLLTGSEYGENIEEAIYQAWREF